jgi:excisionase family DNA binding protein
MIRGERGLYMLDNIADDFSIPMTTGSVAKVMGVSESSVRRLADGGELPFYRVGLRGHRRYRKADVLHFLAKCREARDRAAKRQSS